jgi:surface antigen
MTRFARRLVLVSLLGTILIMSGACNKAKIGTPTGKPTPGAPPQPGMGGPGMMVGRPGMGGPRGPIHDIMVKLTKGPQSLTAQIGEGLKAESPDWVKLQAQTKESAELASSMAKHDPPRGSKESWTKLSGSFVESVTALDDAAQGKDKNAALEAHQTISSSCAGCHREHRAGGGRPGKGGFRPGKAPSPPA